MDTTKQPMAVQGTSPIPQGQFPSEGVFAESSEDFNAPNTIPAEAEQPNITQKDDLSEKSQNRFQELANTNRDLQQQLANYQLEMQRQQEYLRQVQDYLQSVGQVQEPNNETLVQKLALELEQIKANQRAEQYKAMWNEAISAYPEIERDVDLDNLIFSLYESQTSKGIQTTPKQVADQVMKYLEKIKTSTSDEAYRKAESNLSQAMGAGLKMDNSKTNQTDPNADLLKRVEAGDSDAWSEALGKGLLS